MDSLRWGLIVLTMPKIVARHGLVATLTRAYNSRMCARCDYTIESGEFYYFVITTFDDDIEGPCGVHLDCLES